MPNRDDFPDPDRYKPRVPRVGEWEREESWWRENFASRKYVVADRGFEFYRAGYRYGYESANRHQGRRWSDCLDELRAGWETYHYRSQSTWSEIEEAVHDAWDHVAGREHVAHWQRDRRTDNRG